MKIALYIIATCWYTRMSTPKHTPTHSLGIRVQVTKVIAILVLLFNVRTSISPNLLSHTLIDGNSHSIQVSTATKGFQYTIFTIVITFFINQLGSLCPRNCLPIDIHSPILHVIILSTMHTCIQLSLCIITYGCLSSIAILHI